MNVKELFMEILVGLGSYVSASVDWLPSGGKEPLGRTVYRSIEILFTKTNSLFGCGCGCWTDLAWV